MVHIKRLWKVNTSCVCVLQFQNVQKEIENKNLEIEKLKQEGQKLQAVIRSLEKDIVDLKNSVQERDGIIHEKVTSIKHFMVQFKTKVKKL